MTEEVVYLRFIMTGGFSIFGDSIFAATQRVGNFSKKKKAGVRSSGAKRNETSTDSGSWNKRNSAELITIIIY